MRLFPSSLAATLTLLVWPLAAAEKQDISAKLAPLIEGKPVPGMVAAAMLDGKLVAIGATGVRKLGDPTRVTVDDRFHLGSCTKSMTASLAAMMVADGKVQWDDTVAAAFPDLQIDPGFRKATLRELLSNTGGAPGDVLRELWDHLCTGMQPEPAQRAELVAGILQSPPAYVPGEGSIYSNAGFSIAGAMLEKAAGKPYDTLLTERLFKPLHMDHAGFGPPATNEKVDQPYGHSLVDGKLVVIDPYPAGDNPPAITPAGRVNATIEDFARYANFHLGRAARPLTPEQLAFLHQPVAPSKEYAMGWLCVQRPWAGGTALTHTGTNKSFFAVMWLAPERNFCAVAACNSGEGAKACDDAIAMMIQMILEK